MYLPRYLVRSLKHMTPFDDGAVALLKHRAAEPDWTSGRRSAVRTRKGVGRTGSAGRRGVARL
jgi:hypothetical protein